MFTLIKRPLYVLSNKLRRPRQPVNRMKEKWIADFSKPERSCFDIKPEISYNAYLEKNTLFLGLKKKNCLSWLETAPRVYVDQIIEAHFRFDSHGGYCAAGIMFRIAGQGTYYLALLSSKGYFRLDVVNNTLLKPLVGWTEAPGLNERNVHLGIIAKGEHLIFLLNDKWIAEAYDDSIPGGHLGFALVSYDEDPKVLSETLSSVIKEGYVCQARLDYLSVDSRAAAIGSEYKKWDECIEIGAECRLRLAESLASLNRNEAAYDQVFKAWKQREEAGRSVTATSTEVRARGELLFAAGMASRLGQYAAAEEHIDACFALGAGGTEELNMLAEKAKILSAQNKYEDLAAFLPGYIKEHADISVFYALLGHAHLNLKKYNAAAAAWDRAFSLDTRNGLYAANAGNAFEQLGKKSDALRCYLYGAQCFLQQEDYTELGALIPRLLALGKKNWEAHTLAGKWALGTGDLALAETELALAEKLKHATRSATKKPAKIVTQKPAAKTRAKPKAEPSRAAKRTKTGAKPGKTKKQKKPVRS